MSLTVTTAAAKYKHAERNLAGIRYRMAGGLLTGRNSNATAFALSRWEQDKAEAVQALVDAGARDVVAMLVEEEKTAARVRDAKANGVSRPELAARLRAARTTLRTALAAA